LINYVFITDSRDNKTYKTTAIGEQVWMAENLNYDASGSKCYDNEESNCDKYGRLYSWATAMDIPSSYNDSRYNPSSSTKYRGICPENWHIPNDADWNVLMRFVDSSCSGNNCDVAGTKLKAKNGWNTISGNGTDDYGFSALPGSAGVSVVGYSGSWWSSSESSSNGAYRLYMSYSSEGAYYNSDNKGYLFSVRCLQD